MTAQIPDVLMIEGERHKLFTNPLDHMPDDRRRGFRSRNSANWRGYVALWEIRDGWLYLVDIHGEICARHPIGGARRASCGAHHENPCLFRPARMEDFSGDEARPIVADWFTGELRAPQGRMLRYEHMGYNTRYERYLLIAVERGQIVGERTVPGKGRPALVPKSELDLRRRLLRAIKRALP